jgi:plastocyanin
MGPELNPWSVNKLHGTDVAPLGSEVLPMIRQFAVALGVAVMCSACGGSSSPSAPSPSAGTPTTAAISIPVGARSLGQSAYVPNPITVSSGTAVTWTNTDSIAHTSTSTDPGATFDSGSIPAGGKFSFTFQNKGTFAYHCTFHAGMVGTVVVQ